MKRKQEKIILFQGTFDILNWGHIQAFKMCKAVGGKLIVALNTDKLVRSYKQREPVLPFWQKKEILEAIKYIDKVVPAPHFSPIELLIKYKANVYCVGSEWVEAHKEEMKYIKDNGGEIVITPEFPGVIHTSDIKKTLLAEAKEEK